MHINTDSLAILNTNKLTGMNLRVTEYVDLTTGEIVSAAQAKQSGVRSIRPNACRRRLEKLDSLRPEPRAFADFILKFRNDLCGFLVPLDELVHMYAYLTRKEPKNIRRYFLPLIGAGILEDDLVLNKDFAIHNPKAGREGASGHRCQADSIFVRLLYQAKPVQLSAAPVGGAIGEPGAFYQRQRPGTRKPTRGSSRRTTALPRSEQIVDFLRA